MKRALMVVAAMVVLGLGSARANADPPLQLYVDASWAGTAPGADPDGSGPATSFGTDAFATIGGAVAAATAGATITIDAGSYSESDLHVTQPGVTLAGSGSDVTHVMLDSLELDASNVVVQDLDIHGGGTWNPGTLTYTGPDEGGVVKIEPGAEDANIQRCVVSDGEIGVWAGGGGGADGAFVQNNEITHVVVGVAFDGTQADTLQFNSIHDTGDVTAPAPQAAVVVEAPGGGNFIEDNTIVSSVNDGVSVRSDGNHIIANDIEQSGTGYPTFAEPAGIDISMANDNELAGNIIRNAAFAGMKLGSFVDGTAITSNTIDDTQHGGAGILITAKGATRTTMTQNDVFDNGGWGISQVANDGTSPTSGSVANQNDLTGNASGGLSNADVSSFDATNNWWGDPTGPSGDGPGSGAAVSGAGFTPWIRCSVESQPCGLFNVTPPSLTGTAAVGQTLHGSRGTWSSESTITYAYQWQRCDSNGLNCNNITSGGAGLNYIVHNGDIGSTLELQVTATDSNGPLALSTDPTSVVPGFAPANTVLPTVGGTAAVGQTLTGTRGTWSGPGPITYGYQWSRCDASGNGCVAINPGGGALTYAVRTADAGGTLEFTVTATNASGSTPESVLTAQVPGLAPIDNTAPTITGTAAVGQTLTGTKGTWTRAVSYAHQWERCDSSGNNCSSFAGNGGLTYTVRAADVGHTLVLSVTATSASNVTTTVTSAPTGVVPGSLPTNTAAPTISGTAAVGQTLTGTRGAWIGATSYTYRWQRCDTAGNNCAAIGAGGNGLSYIVHAADVGHTLELQVTAINSTGSSTPVSSAPVSI